LKGGDTVTGAKSRRYETLVTALITSPSIDEALEKADVKRATYYRWRETPEFKELLLKTKREVVSQAVTMLQGACSEAVEALREVIADRTAPTSSRVTAARVILEMSFKAVEIEDLSQRIENIEALLKGEG
jgi:ACT domain-containing protein